MYFYSKKHLFLKSHSIVCIANNNRNILTVDLIYARVYNGMYDAYASQILLEKHCN